MTGKAADGRVLVLSRAEVERLLPMSAAIEVVRNAVMEYSAGRAQIPLRTRVVVEQPAAEMYVMPGHLESMAALGVKIWSRFTIAGQESATSALIVYRDLATGTEVVMDAGHVTDVRTGAVSAVACTIAARPGARVAALIGSGAQAATQLDGVLAATDVDEVRVWSRSAERANEFVAAAAARHRGRRITAARTAEEAVRESDIVLTATTSSIPVVDDDWVADRALVCGIGSHTLDATEIHPRTVARAELIMVDTREGTLATAGDIRGPLDQGLVGLEQIRELGEVAATSVARTFAAPAVFKSVGFAALDVAAAKAVTDAALRAGIGTWIELH